jgi:O-antigen/teichoic acid export membrane protein
MANTRFLKKALKNKVLQYVLSRYATYLIQFINSLFIAVYLGPYYLGIWGFITLIIQYLNQINLGISHSVNAIIAINKSKEWYVEKVIGTSITMLLALSFFVILFFTTNEKFHLNIGSKYNFSIYAPAVALIGILGYFNSLLSSVFRVYGRVIEIAINQSAFPVLMLISILIFKGENLIWALVGANLLAFFLSLCLYLITSPVKLKPLFIVRLFKTIQVKGWHLFVYNTSFYLIIISTRTFVSAYYTVEEFGYFTFAFSLANVVLLLLESFSFLIYPKLLNRLASASNKKITELLNMLRDMYITTSHLLIHLSILFLPLFLLFFPQYNQSANAFKLIALTMVLYTNSFGYSGLLIAKGGEKKLGWLAFGALITNILISLVLIKFVVISFENVIFATMATYFVYVFFLGKLGRIKLHINSSIKMVLNDIFPIRLLIPYFLSLSLIYIGSSAYYFILPLLFFVILNFKLINNIKLSVNEVISNPDFINI